MIFTHELIHYKHHDLIWKHLANIICCIYWFQPALKDVFYQLDQWGETYCDRTVCEYLPDVKGYFSTIFTKSITSPGFEKITFFVLIIGPSFFLIGTILTLSYISTRGKYLKKDDFF